MKRVVWQAACVASMASLALFHVSKSEAMLPGSSEKAFQIPGESMAPNLFPGDIVMAQLIEDEVARSSMELGAIIFFKNEAKDGRIQIGRIIATGQQEVSFRKGVVYVDGAPVLQETIGKYEIGEKQGNSAVLQREVLGARSYEILDLHPDGPLDNRGPYTVPEGHYFILGDNRDRSTDSRVASEVGYVPARNVIGEAKYIVFSNSDISRIGKRLDD